MPVLDSPVAVRRAAMDLLARREHGRVELERKLLKRGAPSALIDQAITRLTEEGLLSESRYLEAFIQARARSGHGPLRIREELAQRGLLRSDIEAALGACEFDWAAQLRDLWQRKFPEGRPLEAKQRAKQARFLIYRGYAAEMVSRLLAGRDLG